MKMYARFEKYTRFLALFLAVLLVIPSLPLAALAEDEVYYSDPVDIKAYTVTFRMQKYPEGWLGEPIAPEDIEYVTLKTETVLEGGDATAPDMTNGEAVLPDETTLQSLLALVPAGYAFVGWDRSFSGVTEDVTVTAEFDGELQIVNETLKIEFSPLAPTATQYNLADGTTAGTSFYVTYQPPAGVKTSKTVLVISKLAYGTAWGTKPQANTNIAAVADVDENTIAIQLRDGQEGSIRIQFVIQRGALTQAQCVQWMDEGVLPGTNFTAAEYTLESGLLKDVKTKGTLKGQAQYFETNIAPANLTAQPVTASHTYRVFTWNQPVMQDFTLSYGWGKSGGNDTHYYSYSTQPSLRDPSLLYAIPTVHYTDAPLMEIKGVKLYIPDDRLYLNDINVAASTAHQSNIFCEASGTSHASHETMFQSWKNWSISTVQNDGDGKGSYVLLTPPAGVRVFNNGITNGINNDAPKSATTSLNAVLNYGISTIHWKLVNPANPLTGSRDGRTVYQAGAQSELIYQIPSGMGAPTQQAFAHASPRIELVAYADALINAAYNEPRNYDNGTNRNVIAGSTQATQSLMAISNIWYRLSPSGNKDQIEYLPATDGACTMRFEYPYEIQPTSYTFTDNSQLPSTANIATFGRQSQMGSMSYFTKASGEEEVEHSVSAAQIAAVNAYYSSKTTIANPVIPFPEASATVRVTKVIIRWNKVLTSSVLTYPGGLNYGWHNSSATSVSGTGGTVWPMMAYKVAAFHEDGTPVVNYEELQVKLWVDFDDPNTTDITPLLPHGGGMKYSPKGATNAENKYLWWVTKVPTCPTVDTENTGTPSVSMIADGKEERSAGNLYLTIGQRGEREDLLRNPNVDFYVKFNGSHQNAGVTAPTLNGMQDGYGSEAIAFLTGGFVATPAMSGWTFTYSTNQRGGATYTVPVLTTDTAIQIPLNEGEYFRSLSMRYEGDFSTAHKSDGGPWVPNDTDTRIDMMKNIKMRYLDRNPFTGEKLKVSIDYFGVAIQLRGYFYHEACVEPAQSHVQQVNGGRGADVGFKVSSPYEYPPVILLSTERQASLMNTTTNGGNTPAFNVVVPSAREGGKPVSVVAFQGASARGTLFFNIRGAFTSAYNTSPIGKPNVGQYSTFSYPLNSFSGTNLWAPWGISEAVFVELTNPFLMPELDSISLFGVTYKSGNLLVDTVQAGGKSFLKLQLRSGYQRTDTSFKYYSGEDYNHHNIYNSTAASDGRAGGFLELGFKVLPGAPLGITHPIGDVYLDYSELLDNYAAPHGFSKDGMTNWVIDGGVEDSYGLSSSSASGKKLFKFNFGPSSALPFTVNVTEFSALDSVLVPGKKNSMYDFEDLITDFVGEEKEQLNGLITIQNGAETDVFDVNAYVNIPRKGVSVTYEDENHNPHTIVSQNSLYLRGAPIIQSDSTAISGNVTFAYTADANPSRTSSYTYDPIAGGWDKVTGIRIHMGQLPQKKALNLQLNLRANEKTAVGILDAYASGSYTYRPASMETAPLNKQMSLSTWRYGDYLLDANPGHVFWDCNEENGKKHASATNEAYVKLAENVIAVLYEADGITEIDRCAVGDTSVLLNGVALTDGQFSLRSYKPDAGQIIRLLLPTDQDYIIKPTLKNTGAYTLSKDDSDFDRATFDLVLPKLTTAGFSNISAGLVKLPKLNINDTFTFYLYKTPEGFSINSFTKYTAANFTSPVYRVIYGAPEDPSVITFPQTTDLGTAPQVNKKYIVPTLVGEGETKAKVRITNALGDVVEKEYTLRVVLPRVDIAVTKAWADYDDVKGVRPESAVVELVRSPKQDGSAGSEVADTQTLSEENDWAHTFESMPQYNTKGMDYAYTVREVNVDSHYTAAVTGTQAAGYTITNTLTAVQVSYNDNGASDLDYPQTSGILLPGTSLTQDGQALPTDPERATYTFEGWFTQNGSGNAWGQEFTADTVVAANMTVYAKWKLNEFQLTVYVAADGARMPGTLTAPVPNQTGGSYVGKVIVGTAVSMVTAPALPGYTFSGWTADAGSVDASTASSTSFTMPASNAVVVANYTLNAPIALTVTAASLTATYDGTAKTASGYSITAGALESGHALSGVSASVSNTEAGVYTNVLAGTPAIHQGALDVSYMYDVTRVNGTLTVNQRPLTLTPADKSVAYDGQWHTVTEFTADGLVSGHSVDADTVTIGGTRRDAGDTDTEIAAEDLDDIRVYSGSGESKVDVTANYTLSSGKGTLAVTAIPLTLVAGDGTHVYDGELHSIADADIVPTPPFTVTGLVAGDVLSAASVALSGSGTDAGTYTTSVVAASGEDHIAILRGDEDVSGNYTLQGVDGTLTITQAEVTLVPDSGEAVYNGQPQSITTFTALGLAGEDTIDLSTVTISGSGTNVNDYATTVSSPLSAVTVVDTQGQPVTDNYTLSATTGMFRILPRPVTVTAGVETYVFNGQRQAVQGYTWQEEETDSGLLADHVLTVPAASLTGSLRNAGTVATAISTEAGIEVVDGDGQDVTANYAFELAGGLLTITRRPLTLVAGTESYVYDGTTHTVQTYTVAAPTQHTGLVGSHAVDERTVSLSGSRLDVGSQVTSITDVERIAIRNSGVNETDNYAITVAGGLLSVTPAALVITAESDSVIFDGNTRSIAALKTPAYTVAGLVPGDAVRNAIIVGNGRNVGSYATSVSNESAIQIVRGTEDITGNYDISTAEGALRITPKGITLTAHGDTVVYDGLSHDVSTYEVEGLVSGDQLDDATVKVSVDGSAIHAGNYDVVFTDADAITISAGGTNSTPNYEIETVQGTLTIAPRDLLITAGTESFVYDGEEHAVSTYEISGLQQNDREVAATIPLEGRRKNIGTAITTVPAVEGIEIRAGGTGALVTGDYRLITAEGALTITDLGITLTADSRTEVFDGSTFAVTTFTATGLPSGYTVDNALITGSRRDEGTTVTEIANPGDIIVRDGNGDDATENLTLSFVQGTLTVLPKTAYIQVSDGARVYNGEAQTLTAFQAVGLVDGDTVVPSTVHTSGSRAEVGDKEITIPSTKGIQATNAAGADVTHNYTFVALAGTLTITERPLSITAGSETFVFDGADHRFGGYSITAGSLAGSDVLAGVRIDSTIRNAGTQPNVLNNTVRIMNGQNDRTENYTITLLPGTLRVTPKAMVITAGSASTLYTGAEQGFETVARAQSLPLFTANGLVTGDRVDSLTIAATGAGRDAGQYPTDIANQSGVRILRNADDDATGNYAITYLPGTLTITRQQAVLTAGNGTVVYDGDTHTVTGFTMAGLSGTDTLRAETVSVSGSGRNAGTYATAIANPAAVRIVNGSTDVTDSYEIVTVAGALTITPKPVVVTAGSETYEYNGQTHTVSTAQAIGLVRGDALNRATVALSGSRKHAGSVTTEILTPATIRIVNGSMDATSNYTITVDTGLLTITPRQLLITAGAQTQQYDGTAHGVTEFTTSGLMPGDVVDARTVAMAGSRREVGTTEAEISNPTAVRVRNGSTTVTGNYVIRVAKGSITITPKLITIVPNDADKLNGGADPALTASATGLVGGDRATIELTRESGETNGDYAITVSKVTFAMERATDISDPGNPLFNYTVVTKRGTFSILGQVIYDADGGQGAVPVDAAGYVNGASVPVQFTPAPTKGDMKFLGWALTPGATKATYGSGGISRARMGKENFTLYAVYTKEKTTYARIEYYYDGEIDESLTQQMGPLVVGSVILTYPGQRKGGYKLMRADVVPMTVDADAARNVIRVYYEKVQETELIVDAELPMGAGTASLNVGECIN